MRDETITWIRRGLLFTAAAFILFGISRGEQETVLVKAIHICLECIGIG